MLLMLSNVKQCVCGFSHSVGCEGLAGLEPLFTALRKCPAIREGTLSRLVHSFGSGRPSQNLSQPIRRL
jgi:hypothetical protein